ncbi:MAG: DinB family protein [Candidatus Heimdallarchaeota archaeon]|nr:MAG: DinB family protein [Candidatus Heimdallarchaeota archaeon]
MEARYIIRTLCYALENQVRFVTNDLNDEDLRWRSDIGSPAIGWIVGHVLVGHDMIASHRFCGNAIILSEEYSTNFGMGTNGDFPEPFTLDDLFIKFKQVNGKITKVLSDKNDKWLEEFYDDSGFPPNWQNKNIGKAFILHFNHQFTHTGQILEIRRMRGRGAWGF